MLYCKISTPPPSVLFPPYYSMSKSIHLTSTNFCFVTQPAKQRSAESQRSTSSTSSTQSLWVDIEHRNSPPSTSHLSSSPTANFNSKRPLNTAMQVHVETNTDATANGKVPKLTATTTLGPIDNSSLLQPLDQNKVNL